MRTKEPWWLFEHQVDDLCGALSAYQCPVAKAQLGPGDYFFAHEQAWAIRKGLA